MKDKTIVSRTVMASATCPWCRCTVEIVVLVGFHNHSASKHRRMTSASVPRSVADTHQCIDPTGVTV